MALRNEVSDKTLQSTVDRKLMQKCSSASKLTASVRSGDATISGTIANEHDRRPILRCVAGAPGIRRVVDQLLVVPKKKLFQ